MYETAIISPTPSAGSVPWGEGIPDPLKGRGILSVEGDRYVLGADGLLYCRLIAGGIIRNRELRPSVCTVSAEFTQAAPLLILNPGVFATLIGFRNVGGGPAAADVYNDSSSLGAATLLMTTGPIGAGDEVSAARGLFSPVRVIGPITCRASAAVAMRALYVVETSQQV
jgi:hypothetical protein